MRNIASMACASDTTHSGRVTILSRFRWKYQWRNERFAQKNSNFHMGKVWCVMKRFFTLALVLVFGAFVASAQAGSKGSSSHSNSHSSSSQNSSHCDHSSDHCHDSCHNGCDHEGCNKPPKEYMGGSKNGPPGTPENPFPPAGHGPVMPPKVPVTTVNWNGPITTVYGRKPVTVTVTPTNGQIPTLGTGFRGLAGAVGTEVGKGVSGVLNAAGDVVGGAASAVGSVVGGVAGAVGDVASGIGSALSDLNPF